MDHTSALALLAATLFVSSCECERTCVPPVAIGLLAPSPFGGEVRVYMEIDGTETAIVCPEDGECSGEGPPAKCSDEREAVLTGTAGVGADGTSGLEISVQCGSDRCRGPETVTLTVVTPTVEYLSVTFADLQYEEITEGCEDAFDRRLFLDASLEERG